MLLLVCCLCSFVTIVNFREEGGGRRGGGQGGGGKPNLGKKRSSPAATLVAELFVPRQLLARSWINSPLHDSDA